MSNGNLDDGSIFSPTPGIGASDLQWGKAIIEAVMLQLRRAMPAKVVSWAAPNPAKNVPELVRVQPGFIYTRVLRTKDEALPHETVLATNGRIEARAPLPEVPDVVVIRGGQDDAGIFGPLKPGQQGLYITSDRVSDDWINKGGPVDPVLRFKHALGDGFFIPSTRSGNRAKDIPTDSYVVGTSGLNVGIRWEDSPTPNMEVFTNGAELSLEADALIKLGATAAAQVARVGDRVAADTTMAVWIGQVTAAITALAGGAPVTIPTPPTDFGVIAEGSDKVLAE